MKAGQAFDEYIRGAQDLYRQALPSGLAIDAEWIP